MTEENLAKHIRHFKDFPIEGIEFRDILPLFYDATLLKKSVDAFVKYIREHHGDVTHIVGLDARGFLFGPAIAIQLDAAFVAIRKAGKLPGECYSVQSKKEYGADVLEMQKDALKPSDKVVIVDDILATGGTLKSAVELVELATGKLPDCSVVFGELAELNGRGLIKSKFHALYQI